MRILSHEVHSGISGGKFEKNKQKRNNAKYLFKKIYKNFLI